MVKPFRRVGGVPGSVRDVAGVLADVEAEIGIGSNGSLLGSVILELRFLVSNWFVCRVRDGVGLSSLARSASEGQGEIRSSEFGVRNFYVQTLSNSEFPTPTSALLRPSLALRANKTITRASLRGVSRSGHVGCARVPSRSLPRAFSSVVAITQACGTPASPFGLPASGS